MALNSWIGAAQAIPDQWLLACGAATISNSYGFNANGCQVRFTAITTSAADMAAGIVAAWNAESDARLKEFSLAVDANDTTKINLVGYSDGRPVSSVTGTTGVTVTHPTTGTGPRHLSNTANYSAAALPVAADTLRFAGLTQNDGPAYDLDALSAVTLALVDVDPSYQGSWGLPDYSVSGYTEFRTKYVQLKSAAHRIISNGPDYDGRFRLNAGGVASDMVLGGSGAQTGSYTVHVHNLPTSSSIECNNMSVSTAPEAGQTVVLDDDGFTAIEGSVFSLSSRTTVGAVLCDDSSGYLDCTFNTLTIRGNSGILGGPNATCATGAGIATVINSGSLDWRSPTVPAAEVEIGTDATLTTKSAISPIPAFITHMHTRSTLDDTTGRITLPHLVKFVECSPTDVTIRKPEGIQAEWQVLV